MAPGRAINPTTLVLSTWGTMAAPATSRPAKRLIPARPNPRASKASSSPRRKSSPLACPVDCQHRGRERVADRDACRDHDADRIDTEGAEARRR